MKSIASHLVAGVVLAASMVAVDAYGQDPVVGCYKNVDQSGFKLNQTQTFNSDGSCQTQCAPAGFNTMATRKGAECWCGDSIPSPANKVDDALCNFPCAGFDTKMCGGQDVWTVYKSGLSPVVSTMGLDAAGSTVAPTSTSAAPVLTVSPGATVVVTSSSSATPKPKSGPNKTAIAVGVVVAVVAAAAIAGGAYLFIRNKKNRDVEEEYRRNAAVNNFIAGGGKPPNSSGGGSSFTDTRLEPSMAQRRMSDGSIADNQDYSRRILKVTNA